MPKYIIEQYVRTLSENATNITSSDGSLNYPSFETNGVTFSPWEYNTSEGWPVSAWLAVAEIQSRSGKAALIVFDKKMKELIPKIAFVAQAYTNYRAESYMLHKKDHKAAYFSFTKEVTPSPLMFMDDEKRSFDLLMLDSTIPSLFYQYWNDAINCSSYTGKLLLMFSAIDTFKTPVGSIDYAMREKIFGKRLKKKLYERNSKGLRHRLVHGYYLTKKDGKNYIEIIHKKVIDYFNKTVTRSSPIEKDVVGPQRNFHGNYERMILWVARKDQDHPLKLKALVESASATDDPANVLNDYEWVSQDSLAAGY